MATYEPRAPSRTGLYQVIAAHLETLLALRDDEPEVTGLPAYVRREFYDCLQCLAYGFLRLSCDTCHKELLLPFSCQRRSFCPSCVGRRMAQTATWSSVSSLGCRICQPPYVSLARDYARSRSFR
jgi:Transposase zinc-binding domain